MFIVTFKANRGLNGLFTESLTEWCDRVEVSKERCYVVNMSGKEVVYSAPPDYCYKVKCFKEAGEFKDNAPVYVVKPHKEDGNWEYFFVTDSRTGHILSRGTFA